MTWSSRGSSEKWGILLAHSTRVKSCLSAAWQMLVTGSLGCRGTDRRTLRLVEEILAESCEEKKKDVSWGTLLADAQILSRRRAGEWRSRGPS
ncbi:hypothetical protein EYF80_044346 [Liparis tanakae]|uniref:Uncharacterized protein n=1 Tax=Liparis tanakae TaxID=230148 RepID=A0A4Z2FWX8_9TELE|nr:hypothetical protein EYF80_044346 [Liparis tanakae]